MAEEIVRIRVSPEGNATISVKGVKGRSCKELTKTFEEGLGKVVSSENTSEMYEKETEVQIKNRA
jgi:hypothetical protein